LKTYQNVLPNGVRVIGLDHSQNEYIRDKDFFALLRKYCGEDAIEMIPRKTQKPMPRMELNVFATNLLDQGPEGR